MHNDGKRILILGAGLMQGPAIRAAKELGCRVAAADGNSAAVCAEEADEFFNIDLKDTPAIVTLAKNLQAEGGLDGVFTAATDFSVPVAAAAQTCGLSGHRLEAALCASDKIRMRECFLKHGVPSPNFTRIGAAEIKDGLKILKERDVRFPVVVKPADNMGARGCKLVYAEDGLAEALENAVFYSRSGNAIVEEFIDGNEFSLEALVIKKQVFVTAVADRHIFFPPYFIEMGHTIPSAFGKDETDELIRVFKHGIEALGLSDGAAKGDIFLRTADASGKRRACVGEIAARLSGGYMSGWTVPYSSRFDVTKAAVKIALGEFPEELKEPSPFLTVPVKETVRSIGPDTGFSAERAWISVPGTIKKIYGLDEAQKTEYVKDVIAKSFAGDEVCFPRNNVEKCGNVLSAAPSYGEAVRSATEAVQKIVIRLEPNNARTDAFLQEMNADIRTQGTYPPNAFLFPPQFCAGSFADRLQSSALTEKDGLVLPSCFLPYAESVFGVHGLSLFSALKTACGIEPELKRKLATLKTAENTVSEKAIPYWLSFIRAGIQGLLYVFDSTE